MAIKNINGNIVAQSAEDVFIPSLGVSLAEALRLRLIDIPEQYESIIQSLQQNVANISDSDSQVNSVVVKCEADSTGNIHAEGTYSKGTLTITLYNIKGEKGDTFTFEDLTEEEKNELRGAKGEAGKSAYDLAIENGFVGTVTEWLVSLKGEKGDKGDRGANGADGADGHIDNVVQTIAPSDTANAPSSKAVADYVAAHAGQGISCNSVIIVAKDGSGNYETISAAVNVAKAGDVILIMPGTYEDTVKAWTKNIHLVGIDRDACILTNGTGNYSTPPLEMNIGSVRNLTIIADNYAPTTSNPSVVQGERGSYGIHIEHAQSKAFEMLVDNCRIISKWSAALGIGLRYNQHLTIRNCELISEAEQAWSAWYNRWVYLGGLYFHNDASTTNKSGGRITVINNLIKGVNCGVTIQSVEGKNNPATAEFVGNTIVSSTYGTSEQSVYKWGQTPEEGMLGGVDISLGIISHGNNINSLNY